MSKIRILRQKTPKDTWKQKTANPETPYIIYGGKAYEVIASPGWFSYADLIRWIKSLQEVD